MFDLSMWTHSWFSLMWQTLNLIPSTCAGEVCSNIKDETGEARCQCDWWEGEGAMVKQMNNSGKVSIKL